MSIVSSQFVSGCGISGVNLCSRDTASHDHAFPSGLLATPTTVSKRLVVDVYTELSALTASIFNP